MGECKTASGIQVQGSAHCREYEELCRRTEDPSVALRGGLRGRNRISVGVKRRALTAAISKAGWPIKVAIRAQHSMGLNRSLNLGGWRTVT